jgi:hypothetical protein
MLPVHPASYIPAPNTNTVLLVQSLIEQRYAFQFLPAEAPAMRRTGPDWLVRHVLDPHGRHVARAALEILDPGSSREYVQVRAAIAQRMAAAGVPTWSWLPTGRRDLRAVPPLPPKDRDDRHEARERLSTLASADGVAYEYGPSQKLRFASTLPQAA